MALYIWQFSKERELLNRFISVRDKIKAVVIKEVTNQIEEELAAAYYCELDTKKSQIYDGYIIFSNENANVKWIETKHTLEEIFERVSKPYRCLFSYEESEAIEEKLDEYLIPILRNLFQRKITLYTGLSSSNTHLLLNGVDKLPVYFVSGEFKICDQAVPIYGEGDRTISTVFFGRNCYFLKKPFDSPLTRFQHYVNTNYWVLGDHVSFQQSVIKQVGAFVEVYLAIEFKKDSEYKQMLDYTVNEVVRVTSFYLDYPEHKEAHICNIWSPDRDIYMIWENYAWNSDWYKLNPAKDEFISYLWWEKGRLHMSPSDLASKEYIQWVPKEFKEFALLAYVKYFTSTLPNKRQRYPKFRDALSHYFVVNSS